MRRGLFFLATEKGYITLKILIKEGLISKIGIVVSFKEIDVKESYYDKIRKLCLENDISFFLWDHIKDNLISTIEFYNVEFALAISWKYIIPLSINDKLTYNLIVFHDSLLPKYRGFAPTPTAIIRGDKKLGVTAIFASDGVDEGDIILQTEYEIDKKEYIGDIISRQSNIYAEMVIQIILSISNNCLKSQPQDNNLATYSIWRSLDDCKINWEKDSVEIYNFIRALGRPYLGAYTFINGEKIIIRISEVDKDLDFELRDVGKIWKIENGCPSIICGNGMIKILSAEYEDGAKYEFKKVRTKLE